MATTFTTTEAGAQTKAECISAYTAAQDLRQRGDLRGAREKLLVCVRDECPAALRTDCSPWLADVQRLIPSVVLGARDASGHDLIDVDVSLDGRPLTQNLDGKPIDVDPGAHTLGFVARGQTIEQQVVFREGEKAREILVTFGPAPSAPVPESAMPSETPPPRAGAPTAVWVLGGTALASLGAYAYFGLTGLSRWGHCHDGGCTSSDADFVNASWIGSDVSLGFAAVGAGLATYFYLSRDRSPAGARIGVGPGHVAARWTF